MEFTIYFKVIDNSHEGGMCSDDECQEVENENESYSKNIILPIEFDPSPSTKLLPGSEIESSSSLFSIIKDENSYSEKIGYGSEYCENNSTFERHTRNFIVDRIVFNKYI